jgi:transcription elongation GreA/GreB family factor
MARALLKKAVDDEIQVQTPSGPASGFIVKVWYE